MSLTHWGEVRAKIWCPNSTFNAMSLFLNGKSPINTQPLCWHWAQIVSKRLSRYWWKNHVQ
jgi:hypothetical protein